VPEQNNSKRYLFHADATGVAGQVVHPFKDVIRIQAASALPCDGGVGWSRVDDFRYKDILSFRSAYTEVSGAEVEDGVFETVARSEVVKFNLLDVVTCDRIVGKLTGRHPGGLKEPAENFIVPTGSVFENLRIGTRFFERLEVAPDFFCTPERSCWSGLLRGLDDDRERDALSYFSLPAPNGNQVPLPIAGQKRNVLGFCIALDKPEGQAEYGAPLRLDVPDFGTVHLGEFFCYADTRRLVMLRAELDGKVQGQVVVGDPIVNGTSYPP
jgi:hypothetical protein